MSDDGAPDRIVGDRYRLEDRLAAGGLSTVWRGTDLEREWPVAIKVERDGTNEPAQVTRHFERECHWISHFADAPTPASLVQFVDASIDGADRYVVSELIRGGALADRIVEGATPGVDTVASLGRPICRALAFLHDNGVAHLDLKPANVLCRRRGPPAVIDLNSAVRVGDGSSPLFHHDPYKPPELSPTDAQDEPAGPHSDVYSLGVLLYVLLAGSVSGCDGTKLADWAPIDPWSRGIECAADLATVVRRATEPLPSDRYEDARVLLDALESVLDGSARMATLTAESTGVRIGVRPGECVGRFDPAGEIPAIVLPDEDGYLSPTHARIDRTHEGWILVDRSLNGTYVERDGEWRYVCSRDGLERRRSAGEAVPDTRPADRVRLTDGSRIAPVRPDSGPVLRFEC
ncbi:serine/threonine-protein kinase [Halovivax cerinus]|uniref:Protein kinase n=1 Tax=Halovivax cerinus TaxID=1487865 RepID=A0ABD5NP04_9EURY|nr:protein kinase [Halovivax cerinus]